MGNHTVEPEAGTLGDPVTTVSAAPPATDDQDLVRAVGALLALLEQAQVSEIDVALGETRIFIRRGGARRQMLGSPARVPRVAGAPDGAATVEDTSGLVRVLSPLTGIFYLTPSPNAPPYVQEGSFVERDQVVGLVEAMKTFNEVRTDTAGVVVRILVRSGELVQVDQPLMLIRPEAGDAQGQPREQPLV